MGDGDWQRDHSDDMMKWGLAKEVFRSAIWEVQGVLSWEETTVVSA